MSENLLNMHQFLGYDGNVMQLHLFHYACLVLLHKWANNLLKSKNFEHLEIVNGGGQCYNLSMDYKSYLVYILIAINLSITKNCDAMFFQFLCISDLISYLVLIHFNRILWNNALLLLPPLFKAVTLKLFPILAIS